MKELKDQISNFYYQESSKFIERVKETRHQTVLKRHWSKFDQLWQRSRGVWPQEDTSNGHSNTRFSKQRETTSTDALEDTLATTNLTTTDTDTNTKEYTNRWVRNLSSTPLTEAQVSLLSHGPNFAVAPGHPPYGDYITAIEQACLKLEPHNAEELRAAMRGALRIPKNLQATSPNRKSRHLQSSRKTNQESFLQQTKG